MSKSNQIQINCSRSVKSIFCEALKNYAYIKYSDTNSLASQASKHDLLHAIDNIEQQFSNNQRHAYINQQLELQCKEAINFHYDRIHSELNIPVTQQRQLMLNLLHGIPIHDGELDAALQRDNII